MAHKTKVNGTEYEIKGGRTMVNGTGYDIKKGRAVAGGTVYEITFETAALKWTLNSKITPPSETLSGTFTFPDFTGLGTIQASGIAVNETYIYYINTGSGTTLAYDINSNIWINTAYRNLSFFLPPTGAMFAWLKANGVPQQ